jgi:hypothetical protein
VPEGEGLFGICTQKTAGLFLSVFADRSGAMCTPYADRFQEFLDDIWQILPKHQITNNLRRRLGPGIGHFRTL